MKTETLERTFICPDSPQLSLSNIRGSVVIRPGEPGAITVNVVKHIESGDADNTQIQFSQSDDGFVKVATRYDDPWFRIFSLRLPCKVDYLVTVPENCALKVRGVSNSAKVESVHGGLDISSVSGSLECHSIDSRIKVNSVSGDFKGDSISGSGTFKSVSADFSLRNCQFDALKLKTISGDIDIASSLGDGPYDFNSVSGNIRLAIPPTQGVAVVSSSLSGEVRTSSPISRKNRARDHRRIEIQDGGVEIRHHSVSGDLIITSADNVSELAVERDQSPAGSNGKERIEILNLISSGDLTVDQALQQLANE